ncbi:MAG: AI-2E family transporter [Desulfocurvibacter africanus]
MNMIREWFRNRFSDPQIVILSLVLILSAGVVFFLGEMLAPVFAALVIAYLLEGVVRVLRRRGIPRTLAVLAVFSGFMVAVVAGVVFLIPLLVEQITQLVNILPSMLAHGQVQLHELARIYPNVITEQQVQEMVTLFRSELVRLGQRALAVSLASLQSAITYLVYLILVPLLIFFFLKDKHKLMAWVRGLVPEHRTLTEGVWDEVNQQTANYIRGKAWEIVIVWAATYGAFLIMGLDFAMLLGMLVGVSVLIPYIGATVVTLPVALVAYHQFGWTSELAWIMTVYGIIQALDGNVLVPVLLSGVINMHPVAIIVAVLVFGGLWGFWGIFFAIPLATLVHAVLRVLWQNRQSVAPPSFTDPS